MPAPMVLIGVVNCPAAGMARVLVVRVVLYEAVSGQLREACRFGAEGDPVGLRHGLEVLIGALE